MKNHVMTKIKAALILIVLMLGLSSCAPYLGTAPVRDINTKRIGNTLYYVVNPGETLYSVAWRYEKDFLYLAELNHLKPPYSIYPGQMLKLNGSVTKSGQKAAAPIQVEHAVSRFLLPTKGKVVKQFSGLNKGLNFSGRYGQPVVATAAGTVVYAGSGLANYGNLIIIKHNRIFLSAYAYNSQLLVSVGQHVRAGQTIAKLGTHYAHPLLHFEIRKYGKPVDPLRCV